MNVAMKEKPAAKPAGGLKVVRDSKVFGGEWQMVPEAKPCLVVVKGNEEEKMPQLSNPFTRGKKEEQPAQLPSDNYFG